jgi:hypothetical protein
MHVSLRARAQPISLTSYWCREPAASLDKARTLRSFEFREKGPFWLVASGKVPLVLWEDRYHVDFCGLTDGNSGTKLSRTSMALILALTWARFVG